MYVYAGALTSVETQLPFEYFFLPFCKNNNYQIENENLGQALSGDIIEKVNYILNMKKSVECEYLCKKDLSSEDINNFAWMLGRNYRVNWILDSLPSGMRISSNGINLNIYENGFPLGYINRRGRSIVYNHHHIIVKVYADSNNDWSVVGFLVQPFSFDNSKGLVCETDAFKDFLIEASNYTDKTTHKENNSVFSEELQDVSPQDLARVINYTYSVRFENSTTKWASRWDVYLNNAGGEVHWISIINSFGLILLLSFIVGNVFKRAVSRDITLYNENDEMDLEHDAGWKQLRGDIFRHPIHSGLFSIVIGSGVQVTCMCVFTLLFACIGFLSPDHRGALLTTMLLVFAFTGNIAGYTSGRVYKMFEGEHWKRNAFGTAVFFPGLAFCMFFIINLLILGNESSGAVSFISLIELLLIWFGISLPLTFLGAAFGYKKPTIRNPIRISRIPKPLPHLSYKSIYFLGFLCGTLPFLSSFVELTYIMNSIWHHSQFYYLFGFLFLCFIVLCLVSGEVSILIVYLLICKEDYRWWWTSLLMPGTSGLYLFIYSLIYYFRDLSITEFSSIVLYFGYMIILSGAFALVTGTAGFISSFIFVRKIYSMIKLE